MCIYSGSVFVFSMHLSSLRSIFLSIDYRPFYHFLLSLFFLSIMFIDLYARSLCKISKKGPLARSARSLYKISIRNLDKYLPCRHSCWLGPFAGHLSPWHNSLAINMWSAGGRSFESFSEEGQGTIANQYIVLRVWWISSVMEISWREFSVW